MDPGNFLTDSGSKIPQLRSNTIPKKVLLTVTQPKTITFSAATEASTSKAKTGIATKTTASASAKVAPPLKRSKTNLAKPTTTAVANRALKTPQVAVKRHASVDDLGESSAAKVPKCPPKTGFPYKSKNWELKLRLAECEEWLTETRSRLQEVEDERDANAEKLEAYDLMEANLQEEKDRTADLSTKLNLKTTAYDKLHDDSKVFLDKIDALERLNEQTERRSKEQIELLENSKQLLQGDVTRLREEALVSSSEMSKLRFSLDDIEFKFRRQKNTLEDLEKSYEQTKKDFSDLQIKLREREHHITELQEALDKSKREITYNESAIKRLEEDVLREKSIVDQLEEKVSSKLREINKLSTDLSSTNIELTSTKNVVTDMTKQNQQLADELADMRGRLCDSEKNRRVLHNQVQDLKGNIRVFCRVRPQLPTEKENCLMCQINYPDEGSIEVSKADPFDNSNTQQGTRPKFQKYEYSFDRVFHPNASQAMVFEELSQLVQSALDGYNVCVFAYGQTGSGKTYTMEGQKEPESRGMIPRTVEHIFRVVNQLETIGWAYTVEVCFIEIYNENIRDLLRSDKEGSNLKIMQVDGKTNDAVIPGLTVMEVKSYEDLDRLYMLAHQNRVVASTSYNERSSRSHSVTKIKVTGVHKERGETCYGSLNLVDLAGSERLSEQASANDPRFREMKNINKSLSELGNVILGLYQKNEHIPYRNSKLTHLLQPALGGSSKTLMLVNISPVETCMNETLCSLRFAQKVNQVKVGTSRKRITYDATSNK